MQRYRNNLSILFLLALPSALEASVSDVLQGVVISGDSDTITYSLRSQRATPSIPATLNPIIHGSRMTLDYQFRWMACSEGEQAVLLTGDSIIIQKAIFGGCIKTMRAYAFHAEMEGLPNRDFILTVRLVNALEDACNPSIKTLSSLQVRPGPPKEGARNLATDDSGRMAFQPGRSKEISKSGFLKVAKTSAFGYHVQRMEDPTLAESKQDTLALFIQKGEFAFESRYAWRQCEEQGIDVRASGDTILVIHRDGDRCNASFVNYGLKGRFLDLPKGKYKLKIMAENGVAGICAKNTKTLLIRELSIH